MNITTWTEKKRHETHGMFQLANKSRNLIQSRTLACVGCFQMSDACWLLKYIIDVFVRDGLLRALSVSNTKSSVFFTSGSLWQVYQHSYTAFYIICSLDTPWVVNTGGLAGAELRVWFQKLRCCCWIPDVWSDDMKLCGLLVPTNALWHAATRICCFFLIKKTTWLDPIIDLFIHPFIHAVIHSFIS